MEWSEPSASETQPPFEAPIIDSPSIAADLPNSHPDDIPDNAPTPGNRRFASGPPPRKAWFKRWLRRGGDRPHRVRKPMLTLPIACVAMAALAAGLVKAAAAVHSGMATFEQAQVARKD